MRVYLCGPMAANTPEQANGWRDTATGLLIPAGFTVINPMRDVRDVEPGKLLGTDAEARLETTPEGKVNIMKGIVARDRFDVKHTDAILANFTDIGMAYARTEDGFERSIQIPSTGSDCELAWAVAYDKIIVMVAPQKNHYREHPFTASIADIAFETLEPACDWLTRNLEVYIR